MDKKKEKWAGWKNRQRGSRGKISEEGGRQQSSTPTDKLIFCVLPQSNPLRANCIQISSVRKPLSPTVSWSQVENPLAALSNVDSYCRAWGSLLCVLGSLHEWRGIGRNPRQSPVCPLCTASSSMARPPRNGCHTHNTHTFRGLVIEDLEHVLSPRWKNVL